MCLATAIGSSSTFAEEEVEVFSNYSNPTGDYLSRDNGVEYGDQINFDDNLLVKMITEFQFETFGENLVDNQTTAVLRFYSIDSSIAKNVGSLELQTTSIPISNGFQTHSISSIDWDVSLMDSFIWTVTFDSIPNAGSAGLTLSDPPTAGSSLSDYFENSDPNNPGNFEIKTFVDNKSVNFTAVAKGTATVVPEPTSIALLGVGLCAFLGYRKRK